VIYLLICRVKWEVEKRLVLLAEVEMVCYRTTVDAGVTALVVHFVLCFAQHDLLLNCDSALWYNMEHKIYEILYNCIVFKHLFSASHSTEVLK